MDNPKVTIYTDGGADPNPGPGGWGVVLIHDSTGVKKELSGGEENTTNNRMEITAAIRALEAMKRPCDITLYTDSEYLKQGITQWVKQWQQNNWMRGNKPVENVDLWKQLLKAQTPHNITWQWLKGHAGHLYNERADQLASEVIRTYHTQSNQILPSGSDVYLLVSARGAQGFWAAMIRYEGEEEFIFGEEPNATSNRLDIVAAVNALVLLPEGEPVRVFTLSDYLRNGATQWLPNWRKRNWSKKDGEEIKNRDVWEWLDEEMRIRQVAWPIVKSDDAPAEFETLAFEAQQYYEENSQSSADEYAE